MTPTVETSGRPAAPPGRRVGTPTVRTGGESVSTAAPAAAISGCRFLGCLDDLTELSRPVQLQNPAPIVPQPQSLAVSMSPNDGRYAFDGMIHRGGIKPGELRGGLPAAPVVKLRRRLDFHTGQHTRPWEPECGQPLGMS